MALLDFSKYADDSVPGSPPEPALTITPELAASHGLLEPGNIDLAKRPRVKMPDGRVATVRSMSIEQDGKEILIPTVSDDGRILSKDDAIKQYRDTGKHLGKFKSQWDAEVYSEKLHRQQADTLGRDVSPKSDLLRKPETEPSAGLLNLKHLTPEEAKQEIEHSLPDLQAKVTDLQARLLALGTPKAKMTPKGVDFSAFAEAPDQPTAEAAGFVGQNDQPLGPNANRALSKLTARDDRQSLEKQLADAKSRLDYVTGQKEGRNPLPTLSPWRNAIDQGLQGLTTNLYATPVQWTGIAASLLPGVGEDNPIKKFGDDIEETMLGHFPGDKTRANEMLSQLSQGAGSMAAFMIQSVTGGAILRGLGMGVKASEVLPVMAGGAASQGVQGYEEAKAAGADAVARYTSFFLNSGLGTSEALPISRFFDRLDAATNHAVARALVNTAAQSFEEFSQELGQQLGQDVVAKFIAQYDPNREIGPQALQQGVVGGILGAIMGGLTGGGRRHTAGPPPPPGAVPPPAGPPPPAEVPEGAVSSDVLYPEPNAPAAPPPVAPSVPQGPPPPVASPASPAVPVAEPAVQAPAAPTPAPAPPSPPPAPVTAAPPPSPGQGALGPAAVPSPPLAQVSAAPSPAAPPSPAATEARPAAGAAPTGKPVDFSAQAAEPASPEAPIPIRNAQDLRDAEARIEQPRSQAAADAGEYKKAYIEVQGFDLHLETGKGQIRRKVDDKTGKVLWSNKSPAAYGALQPIDGKPILAPDGDPVDVYVGDHPHVTHGYVIDQMDPETGAYDEPKIALAIPSPQAAKAIYSRAFSDGKGPQRFGGITKMTLPELRAWAKNGDHSQPLSAEAQAKGGEATKPSPAPSGGNPLTGQKPAEVKPAERPTAAKPEEKPAPPPVAPKKPKTPQVPPLPGSTPLGAKPFNPAPTYKGPATPAEINPNAKVELGPVFRGVEGSAKDPVAAARFTKGGDMGDGVYATTSREIASTYGGGPKASVKAGTRIVHGYTIAPLFPEDVAYLFGGADRGEATFVSGNGIELWRGDWGKSEMGSGRTDPAVEKALAGIKVVIGTPDSVGINQIAVRDKSVLRPAEKPASAPEAPTLKPAGAAEKRTVYVPQAFADRMMAAIKDGDRFTYNPGAKTLTVMRPDKVDPRKLISVDGLKVKAQDAPSKGLAPIDLSRPDRSFIGWMWGEQYEVAAPQTGTSAPEAPAAPTPPAPAPAAPAPKPTPAAGKEAATLADTIYGRLTTGDGPLVMKDLLVDASQAYGGTLAEGKFDRKDLYDAMETAVNMMVRDKADLRVDDGQWERANKALKEILDRLPTQTVRSEEQVAFQQFSTPPNYAAAVVYAAGLRGSDVVMEPSAGTGSILAAAMRPGVTLVANELSVRRVELLKALVGDRGRVFQENAEQIDNILPESVKPTVVVMNPPFSQTAGRMGDKKVLETGATHIFQALKRLELGGRLVAIVGQGMRFDAPKFRQWWTDIRAQYDVKVNIPVEGALYAKYGTRFGTRLLVIDKVPPSGVPPVTTTADTIPALFGALEAIRAARPSSRPAEQRPAERPVAPVAEGSEGAGGPRPAPSDTGAVGPGAPSPGGLPANVPAGAGAAGGASSGVAGGGRAGVAPAQSELAGQPSGGEAAVGAATEAGGQPAAGGVSTPERGVVEAAKPEPGDTASSERIGVDAVEPGKQAAVEITENLYQAYTPERVTVKGAKAHPSPLVQSAAMASISPPVVTYTPSIPQKIIANGDLSLPQLEAIIYAGQAHEQMLTAAEGEKPVRKGFFIGDGTGVGKGREVAGILLDNWQRGRQKAIWISEKRTLLKDAQRDWSGLGQDPNVIFAANKTKTTDPIAAKKGILFTTYDTLKGGMSDQQALAKGKFIRGQRVVYRGPEGADNRPGAVQGVTRAKSRRDKDQIKVKFDDGTVQTFAEDMFVPAQEKQTGAKSRIDQIVEWVGEDFDGVIAMDEAHNMGNAVASNVGFRKKDPSAKALAGVELQRRLPNARVVYLSATGATEVSNLGFADRLGLWGKGTAFTSRAEFINQIDNGGIAAMELVARDMKQLGVYMARNLSYDGVEYSRLEHKLDPNQREIYDTLAESWQVVLQDIEKALGVTEADRKARTQALSAFWGGHQRFFNQIITSLQMPSAITAMEKDFAEGRQVLVQFINTNEASQDRAAAKLGEDDDLEDMDITPRDQIIQLIEHTFPTLQYESVVDEDGRETKQLVVDSEGKPVENKEALAMRAALIEKVASVRVPQGPLDMLLDHFGVDMFAEVTGRKRRFILKPDEKTGDMRRVEERRPASANVAEGDAFQAGKKKGLAFSAAGGTGRTFSADRSAPSRDARRAHYLIQPGWRSDTAVQGLGRSHRSNQTVPPIITLVTTDLQGQKRFISSIARRLAQLGALTKGQRQAGDQGLFSARDNLESREADIALQQFFHNLLTGIPGIPIEEFEKQTGLVLRTDGGSRMTMPDIRQFLNRLLSLKIDMQNRVFDAFSTLLDEVIEQRKRQGSLDTGLETIKADKIRKDSEKTVFTEPQSGAESRYVKFTLSDKFVPKNFDSIVKYAGKSPAYVVSPRGTVYIAEETSDRTDAKSGQIFKRRYLVQPIGPSRSVDEIGLTNDKGWKLIRKEEAKKLWAEQTAKAPEFIDSELHLITGAILPIWDRVEGYSRVMRLQTDTSEQFLGREVPRSLLAQTLKNLGAAPDAVTYTPVAVFKALREGGSARLSNGWRLKQSLVAGEQRIELIGPSSYSEGVDIQKDGVFSETIQYKKRYFVPTDGETGSEVIRKLIEYRPVTDLGEPVPEGEEDSQILGETAQGGFTPPRIKLDPRQVANLERTLTNIVARTMGLKGVEITLQPTLPIEGVSETYDQGMARYREAGGRASATTEGGEIQWFSNGTAIIKLATQDPGFEPTNSAYHEAYHGVEALLMTEAELAAVKAPAEMTDIRALAAAALKTDGRAAAALPGYEARAIAFAEFARRRDAGENIKSILPGAPMLSRWFERLRHFLAAVRRALTNKGYTRWEDIFEDVYQGNLAGRERAYRPAGALASTAQAEAQDPFAEGGAEERKDAAYRALEFAPIDRVIRAPFQIFSALNERGEWSQGPKISAATRRVFRDAKFDDNGRFRALNPILHVVRSQLQDRYGLEKSYVDRTRTARLEENVDLLKIPELMQTFKRADIGLEEAKALHAMLTGEEQPIAEWQRISEPIRQAIDAMGSEAVDLGLLSQESYDRWRGVYVHRLYMKHEGEQNPVAKWAAEQFGVRRRKLLGQEFKGRGLWKQLDGNKLEFEGPTPPKGTMVEIFDRMTGNRVDQRAYRPVGSQPQGPGTWVSRGQWEIRGVKKNGDVVLWRDFTKDERTKMGEIVDARYTVAKTFMLFAHDLATGRLYRDISMNESWATDEPDGEAVDASEYSLLKPDMKVEWVKVPKAKIPKSNTMRWGLLADKYVRAEIWRDLNEIEHVNRATFWQQVMSVFKVNKTGRSTSVHMNNVISNLLLMDMAGVGVTDLVRAINSMVKRDAHYEDAARNGAFGVDMVAIEIRRNIMAPLLEEIKNANAQSIEAQISFLNKFANRLFSRRSLVGAMLGAKAGASVAGPIGVIPGAVVGAGLGMTLGKQAEAFDSAMLRLYQLEDEVFRMAVFLHRRGQGISAIDAANEAREQFIDYDIHAPLVNRLRRSFLPFLAYTYRAVPIIAKTLAHRPWKIMKYAAVAYGLNALSYLVWPGDEDKERKALPDEQQGYTWIGAPRMLRLPWADGYGNPTFLDIRRWIPGGDVFDVTQGQSVLGIPAPMSPTGPILTAFELLLNRSSFTGDDITNDITDDMWQRTAKTEDYLWKSMMPSAAWIPGSWYWSKIGRSITGATTFTGQPYGLRQALESSVGIKETPLDIEEAMQIKGIEFKKVEAGLAAAMRATVRQRRRGMISESEFDAEMQRLRGKAKTAATKWKELTQ